MALAVFGLVLVGALDARAERVVLVRPEPSDVVLFDAWNRLAAELRIHHFEVEPADPAEGGMPGSALAAAAEKKRALAAIALIRHGGDASVDVWLVDRASGKTTLRTIVVESGGDATSLLAIRAVDLLRASLREFTTGEPPPKDVAGVDRRRPTPVLAAFTAPPAPRVRLRADALLLVEARAGVAVGPALAVSYRFGDRFELGVAAAGPLLGSNVDTTRGSASLQQGLAWCDLGFDALRGGAFAAGVSAALGAYFMRAQGEPAPPLQSRAGSLWAALGAVGVRAEVALAPALAIGVAAHVFATLPRAGVSVLDASTSLGRPGVMTSAGIRVAL